MLLLLCNYAMLYALVRWTGDAPHVIRMLFDALGYTHRLKNIMVNTLKRLRLSGEDRISIKR